MQQKKERTNICIENGQPTKKKRQTHTHKKGGKGKQIVRLLNMHMLWICYTVGFCVDADDNDDNGVNGAKAS